VVFLQVENFDSSLILEKSSGPPSWAARWRSAGPARGSRAVRGATCCPDGHFPGVAARLLLLGAMAAGLAAMVASMSRGKKAYLCNTKRS